MERASRSGAHREHDGVLGEGGDKLERPGHGEFGGGGALAGSEEEDVVRWRWTARDEASRPGRSGRSRRSCWQTQLARGATVRMNFASAARSPVASRREEKKNDGVGCSYLTKEKVSPASPAPERGCHGDKDVSPCEEAVKTVGGSSSVASRRWRPAINLIFFENLQNCH